MCSAHRSTQPISTHLGLDKIHEDLRLLHRVLVLAGGGEQRHDDAEEFRRLRLHGEELTTPRHHRQDKSSLHPANAAVVNPFEGMCVFVMYVGERCMGKENAPRKNENRKCRPLYQGNPLCVVSKPSAFFVQGLSTQMTFFRSTRLLPL